MTKHVKAKVYWFKNSIIFFSLCFNVIKLTLGSANPPACRLLSSWLCLLCLILLRNVEDYLHTFIIQNSCITDVLQNIIFSWNISFNAINLQNNFFKTFLSFAHLFMNLISYQSPDNPGLSFPRKHWARGSHTSWPELLHWATHHHSVNFHLKGEFKVTSAPSCSETAAVSLESNMLQNSSESVHDFIWDGFTTNSSESMWSKFINSFNNTCSMFKSVLCSILLV